MSIGLAFKAFFKVLGDKDVAEKVSAILGEAPKELAAPPVDSAGQLLAALQREGRFIDFLQEDLAGFQDAQIGAVARDVHGGCRKALDQYLTIKPVMAESEGDSVTVPEGFDPNTIRLVGKVEGDPPFDGTLRHHGWKLQASKLPPMANAEILLPAEVEL
ncbi:MAG: DUF2760 domain-containing protein [Candidatus Eremiobacteraeota bacterium]|nr:DUF2760 domain-containing protein [Candidatus Eremiobacteraeota bacterium]